MLHLVLARAYKRSWFGAGGLIFLRTGIIYIISVTELTLIMIIIWRRQWQPTAEDLTCGDRGTKGHRNAELVCEEASLEMGHPTPAASLDIPWLGVPTDFVGLNLLPTKLGEK